MAKLPFNYYLHDMSEHSELISGLIDEGLPWDLAELIADQRPFYEIVLHCEADEDTGEVTILRAAST